MSVMLLSVTTKNMALCPKLCPKFLLGLIRRLYSLGSIKYTPLPPFPPSPIPLYPLPPYPPTPLPPYFYHQQGKTC